ncbi:SH2 domain-containing protein 4A [Polymixia lowei]
MLAKILEDMWVEPEVLEALSEEQRRILFLKMREEQVRRWREREEREEQDSNNNRPKKASSKRVSWLLGGDGDVSVSVIGEVDEFRSSKLLKSLLNNRLQSASMTGIQTVTLLPDRGADQHRSKQDIQLPLTDNESVTPDDHLSEEETDSGSAEDDLRDPAEDSDCESGSNADNVRDWAPLYRPHLSSHGNQPPLKAQLSDTERTRPQDKAEVCCLEEKQAYGGRVAQLRRAFATGASGSHAKPPVPAKPSHLQITSAPSLR